MNIDCLSKAWSQIDPNTVNVYASFWGIGEPYSVTNLMINARENRVAFLCDKSDPMLLAEVMNEFDKLSSDTEVYAVVDNKYPAKIEAVKVHPQTHDIYLFIAA